MAIRRTLKDKKKAVERRENTSYQWQHSDEPTRPISVSSTSDQQKSAPKDPSAISSSILGYPLSLIYKDILKTIIFTVILSFVLVALFIWWK